MPAIQAGIRLPTFFLQEIEEGEPIDLGRGLQSGLEPQLCRLTRSETTWDRSISCSWASTARRSIISVSKRSLRTSSDCWRAP